MKEYCKTAVLLALIMVIIGLFFSYDGQVIGVNYDDFLKQHVKFVEYIRLNLFSTHDLAPQLNMNYGLGQSFVTMYYHGMYNPFILLSLILGPKVPIYYVMYFIYFLVIMLSGLNMHILARLNKFTHFQSRVLALLTAFSGAVIFNFAWHPMYVYYFPFMIISLVNLHYLLENKRPYLYSLSLGLVFYTNFFFAPIVSIIQFLYYYGLAKSKGKLNSKVVGRFFKVYLIGVMLGALILIPTYLFALGGERGGAATGSWLALADSSKVLRAILNSPLVSGIGIVSIFGIFYALCKVRESHLFFPSIFLILMLIFQKIVYLLNLNMYYDLKHFIYFIPILWLLIGKYIFYENNLKLKIFVSVLSLNVVVLTPLNKISAIIKIMLCYQIILLYCMNNYRENKKFIGLSTLLFMVMMITYSVRTISISEYQEVTLAPTSPLRINQATKEVAVKPYRTNELGSNEMSDIHAFTPNIYSSLQNQVYLDFINKYIEIESANPTRVTNSQVFDNYLLRNFLAIDRHETSSGKYNVQSVNPIMYGVENKDIYSLDILRDMNKEDRLLALNQGVFVGEGDKAFKLSKPGTIIYKYPKTQAKSLKNGKIEYTLNLPKELQKPGIYELRFTTNLKEDDVRIENITINNHQNDMQMNDYYGKNENKNITFLFDQDGTEKNVKVETDTSDNNGEKIDYSDFKLIYHPKKVLNEEKYSVIEPNDFKIKTNHYYTMEIEMENDGYFVTTIPYDKGFDLFVDGKATKIEKVNNVFVGSKLSKGKHQIKLEYQIPGFKLGVGISMFGLLLIVHMLIGNKKKKGEVTKVINGS